jgi:hypothetical protein
MSDEIRFLATFPPIQSAIKVDGSGGGMRIQLDIPESEMGQAVLLLAMREQILDITVKTYGKTNSKQSAGEEEQGTGNASATPRRSAKKR